MRKIILICTLLLCSCSLNDQFTKTCNYKIKNNNFEEKTIMKITYNSDDLVEEATVIKKYKEKDSTEIIKDIKESIEDYNNKYGGKNIKYKINKDLENEYEIEYYIPVKSLDDTIIEDFKLQKNSVKLFKRLKKENIECED